MWGLSSLTNGDAERQENDGQRKLAEPGEPRCIVQHGLDESKTWLEHRMVLTFAGFGSQISRRLRQACLVDAPRGIC